ncbi:response regulator transcription factor [Pseudomonas sp. MAFF212428]|uniref:Response regulator transcription factor n=1 Tax=Pseudomonas brassicae TaxID=2708063 RepID=A0A6B3NTB1_9PSED|nr:response regulator transcription factor [Pseudomonas brassicae]NER60550.1 response regulator transcription factor [Pseudomonas brassicae]NER65399.1 response regulator transcription factor [Pseudomonas brassicae]
MSYLCAQPAARILAVEDDPLLAAHLDQHLRRRGFDVTLCQGVDDHTDLQAWKGFDLILMDILLPGRSGLQLLSELRERFMVPVILMSALGAEQDRIVGFSQGADDYLPKPFSMGEMDVRIDAVLRRVAYERSAPPSEDDEQPSLRKAVRQDMRLGEAVASFTRIEYRLMEVLLAHPEEVLSKPFLYQQVLHKPFSQQDRVLDMHVSHVRRKLAAIGYEGRLATVWGKGYVLTQVPS